MTHLFSRILEILGREKCVFHHWASGVEMCCQRLFCSTEGLHDTRLGHSSKVCSLKSYIISINRYLVTLNGLFGTTMEESYTAHCRDAVKNVYKLCCPQQSWSWTPLMTSPGAVGRPLPAFAAEAPVILSWCSGRLPGNLGDW